MMQRMQFQLLALAGFTCLLPARVQAQADQTVQFSEASFDKNNFEQLTAIGARKKCEDSLEASLGLVHAVANLSDAQRAKLELAGQIDIHRFFSDYQIAKQGLRFGSLPRNAWTDMFSKAEKRISPLRDHYARGLHGDASLFQKTLVSTLDQTQYDQVDQLFRERKQNEYARYIRITLAMIDRKVPLTVQQRDTITELLLTKTDPPESYGPANTPIYKVLSQLALILEDLQELLSDSEMHVVKELITAGEAAAAQRMLIP